MAEYMQVLLQHAKQNGWQRGDLLRKFTFRPQPPICNCYADFFSQWLQEIGTIPNVRQRRREYKAVYAIAYVYAIFRLGKDSVPERSWVDWILNDLSIPYPDNNNGYDYLETGLLEYFSFVVARNSAGSRMFISGIGRQSGFFNADYAKEYLRLCGSKAFMDKNYPELEAEIIKSPRQLSNSKIPQNDNVPDYQIIWEVWKIFESFLTRGILDQEHQEELAEELGVVPEMAQMVIEVFIKGANNNCQNESIKPELYLDGNNLEIRFRRQGIFSNFQNIESDVVIRINPMDISFRYKRSEDNWLLYGSENSIRLSEGQNISISASFKNNEGIVTTYDITPEKLAQPLLLFRENENGRCVDGFFRLKQGNTYIGWKSSNWHDGFECWLDDQQVECLRFIINETHRELQVRDQHENAIQTFICRHESSLSIELTEEQLATFIPGKRTFFKLPIISSKKVLGVDSITLEHVHSDFQQTIVSNDNNSICFPYDLSEHLDIQDKYGQFRLRLKQGNRDSIIHFCVLPADFKTNISDILPVSHVGNIIFNSDSLASSQTIHIEPQCQIVEVFLSFANGWVCTVRARLRRQGAYIKILDRINVLSDEPTNINLDDLYDNGEIFVYGAPETGVSLRFFNSNYNHCDLAAIIGTSGMTAFKLKASKDIYELSFDYKYLTECRRMTVSNWEGLNNRRNVGAIGLTQYAAKQPEVIWNDSNLTISHSISDIGMLQAPFVVFLPVTNQAVDKIPVVAKDNCGIPDWAQKLEVDLQWHNETQDERTSEFCGLADMLKEPAYIIFIMTQSPTCISQWRRLSAGRFIENPRVLGNKLNDDIKRAFFEVREYNQDRNIPDNLEELFKQDIVNSDYIKGIIENVKRLEAADFILSISSFNENIPSGYMFRNYRYWLPMMFNVKLNPEIVRYCFEQINLFNRFWDIELFGYDEFACVRRNNLLPILDNTCFDPMAFIQNPHPQQLPETSWIIRCIHTNQDSIALRNKLREYLETKEYDDNLPELVKQQKKKGIILHSWRKKPVLGRELNRLRDSLKRCSPDERCRILAYSTLSLLDDQDYLPHFIQEMNR